MSKPSTEQYNDLRDRLSPTIRDEFIPAPKSSEAQLKLKEKLDEIKMLDELERIEQEYIDYE